MLDHLCAPLLGGAGVSPDRAGRIHVAFTVGPHAAEHAVDVDHGTGGLDLVRRHEPHVVDPDRLETPIIRLQPFPTLGRGGDMDPSGHMHADRLAGLGLDLLEEVDRIGLQDSHIRIGVERMETARGVPRRAGGEDGALDQGDVGPAELCKMVNDRRADDAASDHHGAVMRLHARSPENGRKLKASQRSAPCLDTPVQALESVAISAGCGFCNLVALQRLRVRKGYSTAV